MEKTAKELNVPFVKNGSLVAAFSEQEKKGLSELVMRGRENGVSGLEILTGATPDVSNLSFRKRWWLQGFQAAPP